MQLKPKIKLIKIKYVTETKIKLNLYVEPLKIN